MKLKENKNVQDFIKEQIKIEGTKDLNNLQPIDHPTIAKPHTPVYKIHRFYARRPFSVFNELIKHYSNPGSIILDPFCGGGVTIVEGLRLRRKVIGVDLVPLATFITNLEVEDVSITKLKEAFDKIKKSVKNEIESLYLTKCPKCKKQVPAEWFDITYVYECPYCKENIQLSKTKKIKKGRYVCYFCKKDFSPTQGKKIDEVIIKVMLKCPCGYTGVKNADEQDKRKFNEIEKKFEKIVKERKLWYPIVKIPLGEKTKEAINKGFKYFHELFTKRNLLALSLLLSKIKSVRNRKIKKFLILAFSEALRFATKLCVRSEKWRGGRPEWSGHNFWPPGTPSEMNVWNAFATAFKKLIKGKKYSNEEIGRYYNKAKSFSDLKKDATCWILTKSATNLSEIPDSTIDVVITDPPYGANVQYSELCNFWTIWIKDFLDESDHVMDNKTGLIINKEEAVKNKFQKKGVEEYRELLYKIFKECYRVLKPERFLVFTFHNRDLLIWNAAHMAAHDAGFILEEKDGMLYQPPIHLYTTTFHQRAAGAMLGDFILSFKKAKKPPEKKMIEELEIGRYVKKIAGETIDYHGGAKLTTIYNRLIPFLVNAGLLDKIACEDITRFLEKDFIEKNGKWYLKEQIDEKGNLKPIECIPVEERVEACIRSLLNRKEATMDEILNAVFTNLINSNAPDYEEIDRVLKRIAEPAGDRLWRLKEKGTSAQRKVFEWIVKREKQLTLAGKVIPTISEGVLHDLIIKQLAEIGQAKGYEIHIGENEQGKYVDLKNISVPLKRPFGMSRKTFENIRQIDVLWMKEGNIIAAFEVEKSTIIDSGINRFRNLFAAAGPILNIPAYIVVPDKREKEAREKISTKANIKEKLHERIRIIVFSDIYNKKNVDVEKIAKKVIV